MNTEFETWLSKVNETRKTYWDERFTYTEYKPMRFKKGSKFIKILDNGSAWGFISLFDGEFKGAPIRKGDLMKAASWAQPAKHSRGNIFEGTDSWGHYGPDYLRG